MTSVLRFAKPAATSSLASTQATTIKTMDRLSQEAFTTIEEAALGMLQRIEGLEQDSYLAVALDEILWAAGDTKNRINAEAEIVGCNYIRHEGRGNHGTPDGSGMIRISR